LSERSYPDLVVQAIGKQKVATQLSAKLKAAGEKLLQEFDSQMSDYRQTNHINPIAEAVGALPKDELAAMAESFVNLTSFKRKVSMEFETVGGPIDVAVISKGDGFIWIKRKHYFKAELNPHYFARYHTTPAKGGSP
jgi:hypothetical protein